MLISTPEELREYLPSHAMTNISSMMGFFDSSEHDFLMERIGAPLHKYLNEAYALLRKEGNTRKLTSEADCVLLPSEELITLCQRVIVFDAFSRSADIRAISINSSGFNSTSSDDYDSASQDSIKSFKAQCVKEAHAAVNRLLVQLEDWAKDESVNTVDSEDNNQIREMLELWKKSKYYYQTEGLLLNTATALSEYLDIYDSREKFIQLLPDLRFIQEVTLPSAIGADLLKDLTQKNNSGQGNEEEKTAIRLLQRAMAFCLEDRNKMFRREMAHSEALQATDIASRYIVAHIDKFNEEAVRNSPFAPKDENQGKEETKWKNNRKGNAIFVIRPIH